MDMDKLLKISVIVPVYNVRAYLDQCISSIINQTFSEFEILLIDDGSTDGSEKLCDSWQNKDSRIRVYHKENEGLSLTRNYGIKQANGKYIVCVDADDWVDMHFLESLYRAAESAEADIAECDVYRVDNRSGKKTKRICYGCLGVEYTKEERIVYGYTETWRCLYRRDFWERYQIEYPDCHSQARGIYALLVALANKIVCVHKPLYYYRKFRPGSLSAEPRKNGIDDNAEGIAAYESLIRGFHRCNIFDKYRETLKRMLYYKVSDSLAGMFTRKKKKDYLIYREACRTFVHKVFPEDKEKKYAVFGGYNLNRIAWSMPELHDPYLRFNFSSIISIMNPVKLTDIQHNNEYRKIMLKRDAESVFFDIIKEEKVEYLIMDFIEERFDIVDLFGGYMTKSDAFKEGIFISDKYQVISRDTQFCFNLWKRNFICFIRRIETIIPLEKIIIVENYLCEKFGNISKQTDFNNVNEIRKMNNILRGYYDFVKKTYPQIVFIEAYRMDNYFTDEEYEYGTIPSHLNGVVNCTIAKDIYRNLMNVRL